MGSGDSLGLPATGREAGQLGFAPWVGLGLLPRMPVAEERPQEWPCAEPAGLRPCGLPSAGVCPGCGTVVCLFTCSHPWGRGLVPVPSLATTLQLLGHLPGIRRGSRAAADRVFEETGEWVTGVSSAKV